jgi:RNA polymerase sigma factor (sigma-70 family)
MNPTEQQLIQLIFIEEYSLDEVASRLEMSKESLKKKRQRTLKKLKIYLMVPGTETFMKF